MSIANIFARSYASVTVAGVTDVQAVMDAIDTLLKTTIPTVGDRWTEPVADTYQSPADPVSGAYMKIAFVRASALILNFSVVDHNGLGAGGGSIAPGSGTAIRVFAGPTHFHMRQLGATVNDNCATAFVADPSPEAMNASNPVVFSRSNRAGGGGFNNITLEKFIGRDALPASYQNRLSFPGYTSNPGAPNGTLLTAGGSEIAFPVFMSTFTSAANLGNNRGSGGCPQTVWVDAVHIEGNLIVVPIDTGVTAVFEVTNTICDDNNGAARLAFRVA